MADLLTLAQDHMKNQVQDAAVIQAGLAVAFDKNLDKSNLDASFPTYLRSALALITAGRTNAAKKATAYYGAAKRGAGYEAVVPTLEVPKVDLSQVANDLLMTGPVAIKTQLASGVGFMAAVDAARKKTLGAGKRHVLNGARKTIIELQSKDKDAVAWARVSDGQPCHFCAMLLGRGPVYTEGTAHFQAHNGCGCSARPVFKNDPHDGWSPDARALADLWEGKDDPDRKPGSTLTLAEWRQVYNKAVSDPGSKVFETFTDKVAVHISSPAVVAARKSASDAYAAQRAAQKAAEAEVLAAATKAAQRAAETEAKAAAKEAAKIKKWQGKPAPVKPIEPKPASTLGEAAFDPWLAAVKARYADFAKKTGNPKTDLSQSNNWPYVQKVIKEHDEAALTLLKSNHYIDEALFQEAREAMKLANAPIPGAAEAYKKELRAYKNRMTRYKRYVEEWREVNGITAMLRGMDSGLRHSTNADGVAWADSTLKVATGKQRSAIQTYTGSDYDPWNAVLRREADSSKLPDGRYGPLTADADKGFQEAPQDFIVHRGTKWNEFDLGGGKRSAYIPPPPPESLIGTVHTQHSYMSTSVGVNAAFSSNPVQMKILVPEGHGVSWAMPYSKFRNERELLMKRGTSVFIHDVYESRGQWIVEAEILPDDADPQTFVGSPTASSSKKFTT